MYQFSVGTHHSNFRNLAFIAACCQRFTLFRTKYHFLTWILTNADHMMMRVQTVITFSEHKRPLFTSATRAYRPNLLVFNKLLCDYLFQRKSGTHHFSHAELHETYSISIWERVRCARVTFIWMRRTFSAAKQTERHTKWEFRFEMKSRGLKNNSWAVSSLTWNLF